MGGQTMSVRRIVITNFFILMVIFMVGILSFHEDVLNVISRAAKTPVFSLNEGENSVGLEIAIGEGADFDRCADILIREDIDASIFISPDMINDHRDYLDKAHDTGLFAGYYDGGQDEELDIALSGETMILEDDAWDVGLLTPRSQSKICWTLDANKALAAMDRKSFSDKIYEDCIILYRYQNDDEQLKNLIKIIREKGYNITDVKTMVQ